MLQGGAATEGRGGGEATTEGRVVLACELSILNA